MAASSEDARGMTATALVDVAPSAETVEAPSGATSSAAENVEIPSASLYDWCRGPFARFSDDDALPVCLSPPKRMRGAQPVRPFPPMVCEMCLDSRVFVTRNSYNSHLKKKHAGVGAFYSAAQERLVFRRRPRGEARLRRKLAGREGLRSWPVPPSTTARLISLSPELDSFLERVTAWEESVTAMRRRTRAASLESASTPPLGARPLGRGRGLLAFAAAAPTEHLASVVSELSIEPRGAPGCPVVALPRQQPTLDDAVVAPGSALASPVFPTAAKPTLLLGDSMTPNQ